MRKCGCVCSKNQQLFSPQANYGLFDIPTYVLAFNSVKKKSKLPPRIDSLSLTNQILHRSTGRVIKLPTFRNGVINAGCWPCFFFRQETEISCTGAAHYYVIVGYCIHHAALNLSFAITRLKIILIAPPSRRFVSMCRHGVLLCHILESFHLVSTVYDDS